jgi:DNA polymerase III subunit epsilon
VPFWNLERKLVAAVLSLFLIPTVVAAGALFALYRRGALEDPATLALVVAIGFAAMMGYLGLMTHALGRPLVRTLHEIQRGAELMGTVNPEHRLAVRTGDELEALAEEVNRLGDRLRDARQGLAEHVERATRELQVERGKLIAVLTDVHEGVVVATLDGVVTLCNPRAQELLGAPRGGILGRSLFGFVDRSKVDHFLERLRAGDDPAVGFTLHAAGGAILEAAMTEFADAEGRRPGVILALRDLSDPIRAEEGRHRLLTDAIRELRGSLASIRSLSESLLDAAPAVDPPSRRRLLEAIHAEAVRLSGLVVSMEPSGPPALAAAPTHLEEMAAGDLLMLTVKRLGPDGEGQVAVAAAPAAGLRIRAEGSALSAALVHLVQRLLAERAPARAVRVGVEQHGAVVQIEAAAPGDALPARLELALEESVTVGVSGSATVRDIVARHAGEAWAFAEPGRIGFRVSVPAAGPETARPPRAPRVGWAGAGAVSGWDEPEEGAIQEDLQPEDLYDFSLMDVMERHLPGAARDRLLDELTYVVLDTETTGLRPEEGDRVVSLAGVRVRGGAVKRAESFDALVNPGRAIPGASTRFHGITDEMVAGAPSIDAVLPAFARFVEGSVLVGHEVWFDLRFLDPVCVRLGRPALSASHAVLDVRLLSRAVHGTAPDHDLEVLAERLGVRIRGRHSALGDALATAETFVRLLGLLHKRGWRTLGDALEAIHRARGPRRAGPGPERG